MIREELLATVSRLLEDIRTAIDSGDEEAEARLWGELVAACGQCDWKEAI